MSRYRKLAKLGSVDAARAYIRFVHDLFARIAALPWLPWPTACAINGACLDGGLELALDDPKTRLGLPEVLLGIHPGLGGSMRFIRQPGPAQGDVAKETLIKSEFPAVQGRTVKINGPSYWPGPLTCAIDFVSKLNVALLVCGL